MKMNFWSQKSIFRPQRESNVLTLLQAKQPNQVASFYLSLSFEYTDWFWKKRFFSNFDQFSSISNASQNGPFWAIGVWQLFANDEKILKMSFYHLQTLGSCRGTSQLSVNIFWTSNGCLNPQKLDFSKKICKHRNTPCLVGCANGKWETQYRK